jgi:hypothetical protein
MQMIERTKTKITNWNSEMTREEALEVYNFAGFTSWKNTPHNRELMKSLVGETLSSLRGKR